MSEAMFSKGFQDYLKRRQEEEQARWEALPQEEKDRVEEEKKHREAMKEREHLMAAGFTPRFIDASWENFKADTPEKQTALAAVKGAWKNNLFMSGKSGTGKTHLAMCLVKEGAEYRRLPDVFREIRLDFQSEQKVLNRLGKARLLILDEPGRQKFSPFENNLFFEIIDKRWNNCLPTTIITNMNKQEFADVYGSAILDRLRPMKDVRFNWESARQ